MTSRIGVDIGGTFTDLILVGDDGKAFILGKVLTTPSAPDDAVIVGVRALTHGNDIDPATVGQFVHGTTLLTNALIERKGALTALVTTLGFRDAIEIAREHRFDMYDLQSCRPEALVPRYLRFEVNERVLADGSVLRPLQSSDIDAVIERIRASGVTAVGICLMHAYANPMHEQEIAERIAKALPDMQITCSSDLVPEIREYDRTSTTLANVYVKGIAQEYLARLSERLTSEQGMSAARFVMQSNGGVCEFETASRYPIKLVESGPAGGALAAAHYGKIMGHRDLMSFDMGGTTAKACMILDGEPLIAPEFEVDRRYQFKKGSGLPVKVPVIEMIEIGTGGGSIASVDALRRMQVGPRSAGSSPGPACYQLGGTNPTVTDADVLLGYLNPDFFLGGKMRLDRKRAEQAIQEAIGRPLELDVDAAAWGIHNLANESMASAARVHAIERGKDIAKLPIFAFGGAGPVHAFGVARILRSPKVIYPYGAGVMSAIGFLTAPLAFDFVHSLVAPLDDTDWTAVSQIVAAMEDNGRAILSRSVADSDIRFRRFLDMRYRNQGYEVRVELPPCVLAEESIELIRQRFELEYASRYGYAIPSTPVDVVSWRVIAEGPRPDFQLPQITDAGNTLEQAVKGTRPIYLPEKRAFADVPVYDRYKLCERHRFVGPAIVEEHESTVVINGSAEITVDRWGNLIAALA